MSKVFVVTVLVSIVSENVTETFDVIETEVSPSEGVLDDTVGGVVSVLFEPSSLLLLQEMMVKLKRIMERMMSRYFTKFPISGLGEPNIYQNCGDFTRMWGSVVEVIPRMPGELLGVPLTL